jgi:hypothetical protein
MSVERHARQAVLEALPIEEQRRIYENLYQARSLAEAGNFSQPAIETTVTIGTESRNHTARRRPATLARSPPKMLSDLDLERIVLQNDLRLYIRSARVWSSRPPPTSKTGTST